MKVNFNVITTDFEIDVPDEIVANSNDLQNYCLDKYNEIRDERGLEYFVNEIFQLDDCSKPIMLHE